MLKPKWALSIGGIVVLVTIGLLWLTGTLSFQREPPSVQLSTSKPVPRELATGETLFRLHCSICHGPSGVGTDQGPSFLWKIYVPSHHSDESFYLAVKQGVRAHHWLFGNMPALPHITEDEVSQIIPYVRWLQQQAGVR
jgi:mono/diheme cytochrome c family protein